MTVSPVQLQSTSYTSGWFRNNPKMLIVRELEQKNLVLSIASKNPVENQAQQLISASRLVSTCKEHIVTLKGVCAGAILNTPVMRNCLNLTHLVSLALTKEHVQKKDR